MQDQLAGVTYECDFPAEARSKPVISNTALDHSGATPGDIDGAVRESMAQEQPIYVLDKERIQSIQPDLILAQDLCRVCAVPSGQVEAALDELGCTSRVLSLDPFSIEEILEGIQQVGDATDAGPRASALVGALRARVSVVASAARNLAPVRTFCLEWIDPPFVGGHWVPGMVELAGGTNLLNEPRLRSRVVAWEEIEAAAPEVVVFMPCGFGLEEAVEQGGAIAVRLPEARVYATDASAYFSRPGPRIVDGLEILAWALHPEAFPEPPPGRIARLA
ncbi:MAG: ABC transporter substrate-binding protein [Actinobacteria bacterium]|nr:ABC transporter substrate-binding protein [Actinomycetota bacterium]